MAFCRIKNQKLLFKVDSYIVIVICFYLKEYAADYSFSQNSIFSLFGPSMVKNFTPFSQNGRPFTW